MERRRSTTWILIALIALFTALAVWFAQREHPERESARAPAPVREEQPATTELARVEHSEPKHEAQRVAVTPLFSLPDSSDSLEPPYPIVRGRVLDVSGSPVAGVAVTREVPDPLHAPVLATSDDGGWFHFEARQAEYILVAGTPTLRAVRVLIWRWQRFQSSSIIVAPCRTLSGSAVDELGAPVSGAEVSMFPNSIRIRAVGLSSAAREMVEPLVTTSDAQGLFTIERAFSGDGANLRVERDGYESVSVGVGRETHAPVRIVLPAQWVPDDHVVIGVVLRANGAVATEASVSFGRASASLDESGAFRLPLPREWDGATPLVAVELGSQAAVLPDFGAKLTRAASSFGPITIKLGPASLALAGRVLDTERRPLEGCEVALLDPTALSTDARPTLEELSSGSDGAMTDAQGRFEISGLFNREYRLVAFCPKSAVCIESNPVRAGTHDIVLEVAKDALVPKVTGRIVARDRTPLGMAGLWLKSASPGRWDEPSSVRLYRSREDGSFEMVNVPRRHAVVEVSGDGLVPTTVALNDFDLDQPVVMEVDRWCECTYRDLPPTLEPRWLLALDAGGNRTTLQSRTEGFESNGDQLELPVDTAGTFWASESAVEFVLGSSAENAVTRRRVHLVPGQVNVVGW